MNDTLLKSLRGTRKDIAAYLGGDASRVHLETLRIPDDVDVRALRERLSLSQTQFATIFGFKLATLQSWERTKSRRRPTLTARILLTALDRKPKEVLEALVA